MAGPFYSTQLTTFNAGTVLAPGNAGGDGWLIPFDYTTAAGAGPAVGEIVYLCNIPEGVFVAGIVVHTEAMSSAGGTAGADLGDDDTTTRYATAADFDAAKSVLVTMNQGGVLFRNDKPRQLRATVTGETWAATKKFKGVLLTFKEA